MKTVYPVIFTHDNNIILVEIPDLKILTEGKDIADAIEMARDAIGLKGISIEDKGEVIPQPSDFEGSNIKDSTFYEAGKTYISLVDVDFVEYRRKADNKMVRRNVTIPNWLDVKAEKENLNVSKVLQEALMEKVGVLK